MSKGKSVLIFSLIALMLLAVCAPAALAQTDPGTIMAVRVDASAPGTVYLATEQAGVLKTTDNGATWVAKNAGLPTRSISDLAVDPSAPANVYIATDNGAFRSTDGGETWTLTTPADMVCTTLAVHAAYPGSVLLGVDAAGLLISSDYGQTWATLAGADVAAGRIFAAAMGAPSQAQTQDASDDPSTPESVWSAWDAGAVVEFALGSDGKWVMENNTSVPTDYLYSSLLGGVDGWGPGPWNDYVQWVGAHEDGLYFLPDEPNATWTKVSTPDPNANINGMARAPQDAGSGTSSYAATQAPIYAASYDGYVMLGEPEGDSWNWRNVLDADKLGVSVVHPRVVAAVALVGEDGAVQTPPPLWVGTFSSGDQPATVYYSPDGGGAWTNALANGWSE
jgi:photosystem II stability/assembly factor-like uncharacterized protein